MIDEVHAYQDRLNVLGVGVSAINMDIALDFLDGTILGGHKTYVCITGVHGVMESVSDPDLMRIHNHAGMVTPDGMPLVWVGRKRGRKNMDRVCGADLMLALCEHSVEPGYRHFFYGGDVGVAEELAARLTDRFPGLQVAGTFCPPFRPLTTEEETEILAMVRESRADIIWIGLSTPKQERFMAEFVGRMPAAVMIGVGAAFDFHSGRKTRAPYWVQRSGFEWLFRLLQEPKRLWKRYLKNNPAFVAQILAQELGIRRYEIRQ